jgi:hypothetical protein
VLNPSYGFRLVKFILEKPISNATGDFLDICIGKPLNYSQPRAKGQLLSIGLCKRWISHKNPEQNYCSGHHLTPHHSDGIQAADFPGLSFMPTCVPPDKPQLSHFGETFQRTRPRRLNSCAANLPRRIPVFDVGVEEPSFRLRLEQAFVKVHGDICVTVRSPRHKPHL